LILAGGQATRLGGVDKPLLPLGGRPIIEHLLDRLRPQAGPIALSANGDPARYAHLGLPVLADDVTGRGPLGGVLRGLAWADSLGATALLTVPGDTPFIPLDLAARLGEAPAWVESPTGIHPLVAVWPVACRAALAEWLGAQVSGRVRSFAGVIGARAVWFEEGFENINTQDDLERVGKILLF
jgi:molybdopterin-guanine dinucleotide biosynthesis protein A